MPESGKTILVEKLMRWVLALAEPWTEEIPCASWHAAHGAR